MGLYQCTLCIFFQSPYEQQYTFEVVWQKLLMSILKNGTENTGLSKWDSDSGIPCSNSEVFQFYRASESPMRFIKHISLSPTFWVSDPVCLGWTWKSAFLTISQMTLMRLVQGPHVETHSSNPTQQWDPGDMLPFALFLALFKHIVEISPTSILWHSVTFWVSFS